MKYIWTAGMKNLGVKSHAIAAKRKVLKVPQAGLYHRDSQPVNALSITRLNERTRNVPQSRVTTPIAGDDANHRGPAIARIVTMTATSSTPHRSTSRGSRCIPGS